MGGYVFDDCSRLGMSDITVASLIVIMLFRLQMSVDENSLRIGEAEARSIKLLDEGGPKWCVTMSLLLLGCLSGVC